MKPMGIEVCEFGIAFCYESDWPGNPFMLWSRNERVGLRGIVESEVDGLELLTRLALYYIKFPHAGRLECFDGKGRRSK